MSKLKTIVINEYCSINNGICYVDKFKQNINTQLEFIIEQLKTNRDNIIKLTQIYLKAEWIRVKKELKVCPLSIYREKETLKKLEKKWNEVNSNIS